MVALPTPPPSRMTVAEFLDWPGDDTDRKFELVDGEPCAMSPASGTHGTIQMTIGGMLRNHLLAQHPGCRVVAEPGVVPRVSSATNLRIPHLAVTCVRNQPNERTIPSPIVIIEILSPSNEAQTLRNVWAYASIPSLREVLLVHSTEIEAELVRRQPDGNWPERPERLAAESEIVLDSIGFRCALSEFYRDTYLFG